MENFNDINITEVEIENFKDSYFNFLSPYFKSIYSDCLIRITVEIIQKNKRKITFYIKLDDNSSNLFNKAHGGALVSIIENFSTISLLYFNHPNYKTLEFNVNYKNQVELNKLLAVEIIFDKLGFTTCFLQAEIKIGNTVCTQASIIKYKMSAKY